MQLLNQTKQIIRNHNKLLTFSFTGNICSNGQFRCDDGLCINMHKRCDGTRDCNDFSDEKGCRKSFSLNFCLSFINPYTQF